MIVATKGGLMMELSVLMIGFIIIFFAAFIQGITGFGFAVVAVPFLSLFVPLQMVVPIVGILCIFINFYIYFRERSHAKFKEVKMLLIFIILFTPLGTYLLMIIDELYLKVVTGLLVLFFGACLWKGKSFEVKNEKAALVTVGSVSGLLNGSIGLMGLPIALFMTNQKAEKNVFRANIAFLGFVVAILTLFNYIFIGLINKEVIEYSLWFCLALVLGGFIGIKIDKLIKQALFLKISTLVIMISGVFTLLFAG